MGGFLNIGGSSAKTDRKTELTGFGDLQNIFNFGLDTSKGLQATGKDILGTGTATTAQGVKGLTSASDYWTKILSANRPELAAAIAPETNATLAREDAARRSANELGTSRTGGQASQAQTQQDQTRAELDNLLFGLRPTAAKEQADVAGKISDVGLKELSDALGFDVAGISAAGLAEGAASDLTKAAGASRQTSYDINKQTQQDVIDRVLGVLSIF